MAKLFGESISRDVVKQIEQRESILSVGARDSQHLRYLQQKTGWVRAISGTDLLQSDSKYTSSASTSFILSGGRLKWNSLTKKFEPRSTTVNFGNQEEGRYSFTDNLGIRPEPGVTSFSITHKNRFGVIREASLAFTVWTREDLEKANALFLRPGAQIIIEWGNSIYVDNEGIVEDIPAIDDYEEFFVNNPIEKIYEIINLHKKNTDYNYDGFLGFVINFTWEYRMDGGYDCSITVISKSAVLESLTLLNPNQKDSAVHNSTSRVSLFHEFIQVCESKLVPDIVIEDYNPFTGVSYSKTSKKNFLTIDDLNTVTVKKEVWNPSVGITGTASGGRWETKTIEEKTGLKENLYDSDNNYVYRRDYVNSVEDRIFSKMKIYGFNSKSDIKGKDTTFFRYTTLRTVLALINKAFLMSNSTTVDLPTFYLGQPLKDQNISPQVYKTFKEHTSLDPSFAVLPKIPTFENEEGEKLTIKYTKKLDRLFNYHNAITGNSGEEGINPLRVVYNGVSDSIAENPDFNENDILDIHVNISAVLPILNGFLTQDEEPSKINVRDFVKALLDKINFSLGNINELDIHFDEDIQKYFIVDRALVNENFNPANETSEVEIKTINVAGLKSTISNISLQSKISSQLASTIAISSQATIEDDPNASRAFIDFSAGTKNRFYSGNAPTGPNNNELKENPEKRFFMNNNNLFNVPYSQTIEDTDVGKKEKTKKEEFFYELGKAYTSFNSNLFSNLLTGTSKIELTPFDKLKPEGFLVYKKYVFNEREEDQTVIPIELSMTLDGISGFKIGQVFKIGRPSATSNILPETYDNYCFIVTGVDSTIDNSKWNTTLKAQTFRVR